MATRSLLSLVVLLGACGTEASPVPAPAEPVDVARPASAPCPPVVFDPSADDWHPVSGDPERWTRGAVPLAPIRGATLDDHPELREQAFLRLHDGCGPSPVASRMERAEEQLARVQAAPFGPTRPEMSERFPVRVEKTVDERGPDRGLLVHRVTHPQGVPPGWLRDEVRCVCFRSFGLRYARLELTGPLHTEESIVQEARRLCESLEIE